MKHKPSFRIWDPVNNKYHDGPAMQHVGIWYDNKTHVFTITEHEIIPDHGIIEPYIGKIDANRQPIHVGDVLMKLDHYYVTTGDEEELNRYKERYDVSHMVDLDDVPWGFPKDEKYSLVYVKLHEYSTPLIEAQGMLWLSGENAGFEGEGFEDSTDWLIVGTIHDKEWEFMKDRKYCDGYYRSPEYKEINLDDD